MAEFEPFEFAGVDVADLHVDYEVSVDRGTGTAVVRVPLLTTPGRSGFGPSLALTYESADGNSVFGLGWSLSGHQALNRGTTRRLPAYDHTDGYRFGSQDLVPAIDLATGRQRTAVVGAHTVQYFRPVDDTAPIRWERWIRTDGDIHWRMRQPTNVVTVYGLTSGARVADPDLPERVSAWLPHAQFDGYGNVIIYDYRAEDGANVDLSDPAERSHRRASNWPQRYLTGIRYGNTVPFGPDETEPPANRWLFRAVFDFGGNSANQPDPDSSWPARPDAFSTHRGGFDLRTHRLCRRMLMFHDIIELGAGPTLVGITAFDYVMEPAGATLTTVTHTGARRDGNRATMPPLRLSYSAPADALVFTPLPAQSQQNAPIGLGDRASRWVDLTGDGLPGLLTETADAWYFKPNEGGGRLGAQTRLATRPTGAGTATMLGALDSLGRTDVVTVGGRWSGAARRDPLSGHWSGFQAYASMPCQPVGETQWLDVDGDGLPEPLITGADGVRVYALGAAGFGAAGALAHRANDPPGLAEAPDRGRFLVDMTGDGLPAAVQVGNGSVRYWPQLGHGRFGAPVDMADPPTFDTEFDPARLRFVDLDGSGTADLIYLGRGELRRWINAGGNRFIALPVLAAEPTFDRLAAVDVVNLLGDGRSCLVWSSPLPGGGVRYAPLTGETPPRRLVQLDNSIGGVTRLHYRSSAQDLLRDRAAGRDWHSGLAFHQIVVDRIEVVDQISGRASVTRYEYHDGFYDLAAARFAGFGLVDTYDADNAAEPGEPASPSSCVRAWFHTGAPHWLRSLGDRYLGDPDLPLLTPADFANPAAIADGEYDDALRCLVGRTIREETYAVEPDGRRAAHPLHVNQFRHLVQRSQPGVFRADLIQTLLHVYEGQPTAPRVSGHVVAAVDGFGTPLAAIEMGLSPDPSIAAVAMGRRSTVTTFDTADRFEVGIPVRTDEFELTGIDGWNGDQIAGVAWAAMAAPLAPHEPWPTDGAVHARITGRQRRHYWATDRTGPLPLGQVGSPTLHHHEDVAVFTGPQLGAAFADGPGTAPIGFTQLTSLGYFRDEDYWWAAEETQRYSAAGQFSRAVGADRWDGAREELGYDPYWLRPINRRDAAGNATRIDLDFNVVEPTRHIDANGAVEEVRYDPLGVIVARSQFGQRLAADGVTALAFGDQPIPLTVSPLPVTGLLADPGGAVATASLSGVGELVAYDLGGSIRAAHVAREELAQDGRGGGTAGGRLRVTVDYLDGFGHPIQRKQRLAADRWLATGAIVYNAQLRPIREYEPWFASGPQREPDQQIAAGVRAREVTYDAAGRVVRTDEPDGTLTRTQYAPWRVTYWDHNDTVQESLWRVAREALPDGTPEKTALHGAQAHADTPRISYLDPIGREIGKSQSAGSQVHSIRQVLDVHGDHLRVIDARGLTAFTSVRDLRGRGLRRDSVDAGSSWWLPDAADREVHEWDARLVHTQTEYDGLDRPTRVVIDGARVAEEFRYGEDPSVDHADARNARGRLIRHRDQAGVLEVQQYTPDGTALRQQRRVCINYTAPPDWTDAAAVAIDGTAWITEVEVDGLERVVRTAQADGSIVTTGYEPQGGVATVDLAYRDGQVPAQPMLTSATFNARGEQTEAVLGNGCRLSRDYDPESQRVTAMKFRTAGGSLMQDLRYTYDPMGNVTYAVDLAQQPGTVTALLAGATASTHSDYTYDALYRLATASGRVHQALLEHDYSSTSHSSGGFIGTRHLSLNNGQAVERYTQQYTYDLGDNLARLAHQGVSRSWNTDVAVDPASNRALPARDLTGLPVADPQARFDATGLLRWLPHLTRLEWDERCQLAKAVIIDRSSQGLPDDAEFYVYDGAGLRVRKVSQRLVDTATRAIETVDTVYLEGCEITRTWRGTQLIEQRTVADVHDGGQRLARVHRSGTAVQTRYQASNLQDSATLEVDQAGFVLSYEEYFPYGGSCFIAGDDVREVSRKEFRFRGRQRDELTGFYYCGHRYYAPWLGRWLSPDPAGPADCLNLFTYCLNNPLSYHDPDGLTAVPRFSASQTKAPAATPARANLEGALRKEISALPELQRKLAEASLASQLKDLGRATAGYVRSFEERDASGQVVRAGAEVALAFGPPPPPGPLGEGGLAAAPPPKQKPRPPVPPPAKPPEPPPAAPPPGAPPGSPGGSAAPPDDPAGGKTPPAASADPPSKLRDDHEDPPPAARPPDAAGVPQPASADDTAAENARDGARDDQEKKDDDRGRDQDEPLADQDGVQWGDQPPAIDGDPDLGPPVPVLSGSIESGFVGAAPVYEPDVEPPKPRGLRDEFVDGFVDQAVEAGKSEAMGRLMTGLLGPAAVPMIVTGLGHHVADTYREEGRGFYGVLGVVNSFNPASLLMRAGYTSDQEAEQAINLQSLGDTEGAKAHARASGRAYFDAVLQSVYLGMAAAPGAGGANALTGTVKKLPKVPKAGSVFRATNFYTKLRAANKALNKKIMKATGDKLQRIEANKMPAISRGFFSKRLSGAINMEKWLHKMTRTYGWKGKILKAWERGLPLRQTLFRDIKDLRRISKEVWGTTREFNKPSQSLLKLYKQHPLKKIREQMLPPGKRVLSPKDKKFLQKNAPHLKL